MSAVISNCGHYRYKLTRFLGDETANGFCLFILLNPSTADAEVNDPTVRKCMYYARTMRMRYLEIVNLYAYRATNPRELEIVDDPVGPKADPWIAEAAGYADRVICGWGTYPYEHMRGGVDRARAVAALVQDAGRNLEALQTTKWGYPHHPLYLRADLEPMPWQPPI